MFEGLEIGRISRVGHDYALHFSDGNFAILSAEDIEPLLPCLGASIPLENSRKVYVN